MELAWGHTERDGERERGRGMHGEEEGEREESEIVASLNGYNNS